MDNAETRCSAALRAVVTDDEVAAIIGVAPKGFKGRCRAGDEPTARRSFDGRGFVIDRPDVERLIAGRVPEQAQDSARRHLLGICAGTLEVRGGHIRPKRADRWAGTDEMLDAEILELVRQAAADLGEQVADANAFDRYASSRGLAVLHREVMLRLRYADWPSVIESASATRDPTPTTPVADLTDPLTALRLALAESNDLTQRGFDTWAKESGCPLRHHHVLKRLRATWLGAKRMAAQGPVIRPSGGATDG
jgi:hypothetical protein